ncbi:MAG: hypothetical protein QOI80_2254 [Solirubrobacteraceae bacterium]|jgi:hypothetical protein|nr:hypothetical protein [Solirubrobacteraceae bacterium]
MTRPAAVLSLLAGLGFGVPSLYGTWYLAENDEIWQFLGFPTYGGGPFESIGLQTSPGLMTAFTAVCAAEVALASMLWRGTPNARKLSLGLHALEFPFWVGFALPLGPVLGLARSALLIRGQPRAPRDQPSRWS